MCYISYPLYYIIAHDTTVEDSTAAATAVADDRITLSQEDLVLQWSDFAYTSFKTYRYVC